MHFMFFYNYHENYDCRTKQRSSLQRQRERRERIHQSKRTWEGGNIFSYLSMFNYLKFSIRLISFDIKFLFFFHETVQVMTDE